MNSAKSGHQQSVQILQQAIERHTAGHLNEAEELYHRLLNDDPENADALHLLGVVCQQRQQHGVAVVLIRQAIAIRGDVVDFHSNLAEALRGVGQVAEAVDSCREALQLDPDSVSAANGLALGLTELGAHNEAEKTLRRLLEKHPAFAKGWCNLGNLLRELERRSEALDAYQHAVAADANELSAANNLGLLLLEMDRPDEALPHLKRSLEQQPDSAEAQNNYGNVLRELNQIEEAKACYCRALELQPGLAMAFNNLGQAAQDEGQLDESLKWYQQALNAEPQNARFLTNAASALDERERSDEAMELARRAIAADPRWAEAHNLLGKLQRDAGQTAEARSSFDEALRLRPDMAPALFNLGQLHEEQGDAAAARESYRRARECNPRLVGPLTQLATHHRKEMTDEERAALEETVDWPWLRRRQRVPIQYALAKLRESDQQHEESARFLRQALQTESELQAVRGEGYHPDRHTQFVDDVIGTFNQDLFERLRGLAAPAGLPTDVPVFVLGLPRSGTTLTEQILASHPDVFGAGELSLGRRGFERASGELGPDQIGEHARWHFDELRQLAPDAARIVDKMPDNYLYLGWLTVLFPHCRIIHCRRDLRDNAASCLTTSFKTIRWASHPDHVAHRFEQYLRLMAHWSDCLPGRWLDVAYEQVVADTEGEARRMLEWIGLPWDDRCLEFHTTRRSVRTASVSQVRQPIYTASVGRWERMQSEFPDLFERLGSLQ